MSMTILRPSQRLIVPGIQVFAGRAASAGASIPEWADYPGVVAAYDAKNAASQAASYINLANPGTYDCTVPSVAPSWSNGTGWTFDGSTQYLDTGVIPVPNAFWGMVYFSNWTNPAANFHAPFGGLSGSSRYFGIYSLLSGSKIRTLVGSGIADNGSSWITSGSHGINGNKAFRNGIAESNTVTVGTINTVTESIALGAGRPTGANKAAITMVAAIFGSGNLSDADMLSLHNAMAAL